MRVGRATAQQAPRLSYSSDPRERKQQEKELRDWKAAERKRLRREVSRQVFAQYSTMDPFTILTIIQVVIKVLTFLYQAYGLT